MPELLQFLIVFDHSHSAPHQDVASFQDTATALQAYSEADQQFAADQHIEVVLIGSDSLDTVRRTHANDFDGTAGWERLLPTA